MKFYSKFSNHRIVLRPGIPGEPLLGRLPQAGLYVKFESGVADVKDQEVLDLLLKHPGLGTTFISETPNGDPFKMQRRDTEPEHNITELEYGHVGKNLNPKPAIAMSREQKAALYEIAKEMAKEMAPVMAKQMLVELAEQSKAAKEEVNNKETVEETVKAPATKAKK